MNGNSALWDLYLPSVSDPRLYFSVELRVQLKDYIYPPLRLLDFIVSFCVFVIMNGKVLTWYFFILGLNGEHEDIIMWPKKIQNKIS